MTSTPLTSALQDATDSLSELDFFDLTAPDAPHVLQALSTLCNVSEAALSRCMRRAEAITPPQNPPRPPATESLEGSTHDMNFHGSSSQPVAETQLSTRFHPSQVDFPTRQRPKLPQLALADKGLDPVISLGTPRSASWISDATGRPDSEIRTAIDTLRILDAEPETHLPYRCGRFSDTQAIALASVIDTAPDCLETALQLAEYATPEHLIAYAARLTKPEARSTLAALAEDPQPPEDSARHIPCTSIGQHFGRRRILHALPSPLPTALGHIA